MLMSFEEHNDLKFAVPGGLIGVGTRVDPTLCRADRLVGFVLGLKGKLPDIYNEIEINYFLLRRLLGVKTTDGKQAKVAKLTKNEVLMVNIGQYHRSTIPEFRDNYSPLAGSTATGAKVSSSPALVSVRVKSGRKRWPSTVPFPAAYSSFLSRALPPLSPRPRSHRTIPSQSSNPQDQNVFNRRLHSLSKVSPRIFGWPVPLSFDNR